MPAISRVRGTAPIAIASQRPAVIPRKIPMPPRSGVARARQRSADVPATRRAASGECKSAQMESAAAGKAARAARVLTCGEGNGSLLGLCLPAQSVPRLVRDDDGLLRSPALPRALRQSLPARLPGEVQGIPPRDLLVAAQSAGAARRLPRRLRAALPEQAHRPLPDLPPGRPRVLDLLLRVPADRRSVDGRQRRADQEGALPAPARRVLDGGDPGRHLRVDAAAPHCPLALVPSRPP